MVRLSWTERSRCSVGPERWVRDDGEILNRVGGGPKVWGGSGVDHTAVRVLLPAHRYPLEVCARNERDACEVCGIKTFADLLDVPSRDAYVCE